MARYSSPVCSALSNTRMLPSGKKAAVSSGGQPLLPLFRVRSLRTSPPRTITPTVSWL